jgi:hypothetical protein
MGTLLQDLGYGLRMLRKKPTFTIVAVLTLGLGVGANTAIFSIVNAVLLRPLPYRDPGRLVRIYFNWPGMGLRDVQFSVPEMEDLETRSGVFEDVSAIGGGSVNLTGAKHPERLELVVTNPNYFSMLGGTPQLGRLFGPQDFALGFAPVAVISDGLWRRAFGADPNILGRSLALDNDPYAIVGVLPPGFRHPGPTVSGNVDVFLTAGFSADPAPNPPTRSTRFLPYAIGRLKPKAIPAVEFAALTSNLPTVPQPDPSERDRLTIEDGPVESSHDLRADRIRISPDYFRVMQTPLVRGRFFTEADDDGKHPVAIIDESTARRYWADRDPLGGRLRFGPDTAKPWLAVVGIVKDIKHDGLDIDGVPHIYVSIYQRSGRTLGVALRTSLPAHLLEVQIRHEIQSIDPGLPVFDISSMNNILDRSLASRRFSADMVAGFAGVALLLASIGIYGLLAYMVGQRSREIGLRMALGARRVDILKLILGKAFVLTVIGIGAGVFSAAAASSMMASLLYGVRPHDPEVFFAVPLLLLAVAFLASYIPAQRAARLDPMIALREA